MQETIFGRKITIDPDLRGSSIRKIVSGHSHPLKYKWALTTILGWIQKHPDLEIECSQRAYEKLLGMAQSCNLGGYTPPQVIKPMVISNVESLKMLPNRKPVVKGIEFTDDELKWLANLVWQNYRVSKTGESVYLKIEKKLK